MPKKTDKEIAPVWIVTDMQNFPICCDGNDEPIEQPDHPKHVMRVNRRGENRKQHWANGGFITITGDVGTYCGPEAMGIDWMSGAEMSEAIPPAYAEHIGRAAIASMQLEPTPIAYLRDVGSPEDACWVPCAKGDPGALQFHGAAE